MPGAYTPAKLSRLEKTLIARKLRELLAARAQKGPAEPQLDAFIPELEAVSGRLDAHVGGKIAARAARAAGATRSEAADATVDTWARQIESFLDNAGRHRHSPHAASARALRDTAFPRGLAFIDDRIPDENAVVRAALQILRAPTHAGTLVNLHFPMAWLDLLDAAVGESDDAFAETSSARHEVVEHVTLGRDAETEWLDVVQRLQKYVEYRAMDADAEKQVECKALIAPLKDAVARAKALAATRATRRTKKAEPVEQAQTG